MREIKFRGKRIDNGEWVYGYYFIEERDIEDGIIWRDIPQIQQRYGDHFQYFDVDPATIGQYTGLKDKNGTEIYEGDIVSPSNSWNPELKFVVTFGEGVFDSGYYSFTGFYLISDDGRQGEDQYELSKDSVYEIIGNIHDNPELLGGAG
jgi:uncharacterized phage protein (TIGR01671 family)